MIWKTFGVGVAIWEGVGSFRNFEKALGQKYILEKIWCSLVILEKIWWHFCNFGKIFGLWIHGLGFCGGMNSL